MKATKTTAAGKPVAKLKKARGLKDLVKLTVWTNAAGRCSNCNERLIDQHAIKSAVWMTGELAHNAPHGSDPRAPRSSSVVPEQDRDNPENLVLLCNDCHQKIDAKLGSGIYTEEVVGRIKRDHEARIEALTAIRPESETAVWRLFSNIRGHTVTLPPLSCLETLIRHTPVRYPKYVLAEQQGAEVNLTNCVFTDPTDTSGWQQACLQVDRSVTELERCLEQRAVRHISVFPFARIPVLVYAGQRLGNKTPISFFQKRHSATDHFAWNWLPHEPTREFAYRIVQHGTNDDYVALLLSVSAPVTLPSLPATLDSSFTIYEIVPAAGIPEPSAVLSEASLDRFRQCYKSTLAHIEYAHKLAPRIHVILAVPAAVAVVVGAEVMPDSQPSLRIYDRHPDQYEPILDVNLNGSGRKYQVI